MTPLHHEVSGPADGPPLVLGPSLGTSTAVWGQQLPGLSRDFRTIAYDLPGHGGSATGPPRDTGDTGDTGDTTVADLAGLVLSVADGLGLDRFHYAGISLGGAVGAHLAAHHPDRVASLALVCSSAHFGPPGPWRERARLVRDQGTAPLLDTAPDRWFSDESLAATGTGRRLLDALAATAPAGYAACCDALAAYDLRDRLADITAPTLVVGGSRDMATPLPHARELAAGVPRSTLEVLECGHLAAEAPSPLLETLRRHLGRAPTP
ncbi:alpha/beta fold hydrolase [Streptomyces endophyticus]|uniref:Alpha/beta fold hydrolase n=1 Tax=Streptomyces endophyticus TaxID=714166 RepID=A0ABU6F4P5_9ACTN|nr:alpha/beta fold hydrolase [Streptomyces endophyticus]MEB8338370.1 alpha/beta fold hydrolase [Streptomyces endophyticus]